jgi:hypothetical protein
MDRLTLGGPSKGFFRKIHRTGQAEARILCLEIGDPGGLLLQKC